MYECNFKKIILYLHSFLHPFYALCEECNLGWTDEKLHSYIVTLITKIEMNNNSISWRKGMSAQGECNMIERGKIEGLILSTSSHFYFLKLHSCNYTLPPLIKRRNKV